MNKPLPEIEYLRKILRYEPNAGKLFWLHRDDVPVQWNTRYAGKEAFTAIDAGGYRQGKICGKKFKAHRVIWAIVYGNFPKNDIDHINVVKTDNRVENIREATQSENQWNKSKYKNNTSGVKGVCWDKQYGKWAANIMKHGRKKHIGRFANIADAALAYASAAAELHGEFANHGGEN